MRKVRKFIALLLTLALLMVLLASCGSKKCVWCGKSFSGSGHNTDAGIICDDCYNSLSGGGTVSGRSSSNTGVWIAVIVMVFIAVFSATSGIVYLVLQRLLPPEKPASRSRRVETDEDDFEAPRPAAPAAPRAEGGVWICPRDKSRNTGPYCAVCGGYRPTAPKQNPQGTRPNMSAQGQNSARPSGTGAYGGRPQQPAAQPRQQMPVSDYRRPEPQTRQPVQPETRQYQPAAQEPQKEYKGRFARREPEPEEPEVDSELLAAIFREAAKDPEEN